MTEDDSSTAGAWRRLLSTALVGVNRQAVPDTSELPTVPAGEREPAATLLERAGAATVRHRAGHVPGTAEPMAPAPSEPRPVVPETAARRLEVVLSNATGLGGQHGGTLQKNLLGEWLDLAAARGMRVPPAALPRLLELGYGDRSLRPGIAAVAGERARWLAELNPTWGYVTEYSAPGDGFDPVVWERGSDAERCRTLTALREREPDRARALLGEVWAGEKAEVRRELLWILATNLSPNDEPFLDRALDDRGATVRGGALALLARLPDSAHARRLCAHARECVWRGTPNRGGDRGIRVVSPEPTDPDLARDLALVVPKKKDSDAVSGEWLWALLTHTPLWFWPEHLAASPAEIGKLVAADGEWEVLAALGNAAVVQRAREWARSLLPATEKYHRQARTWRGTAPSLRTLMQALPPEERCARVARLIADDHEHLLGSYRIMGLTGKHWTEGLSERVAELIEQLAVTNRRTNHLPGLCTDALLAMAPATHERFTPVASESYPAVAQLEATLRFRREMREEFG